jgi:hypothetical protein
MDNSFLNEGRQRDYLGITSMILGHNYRSQTHRHKLNARVPGPVSHQTAALTLRRPIRADKVRHGGYRIEFHGPVPPGSTVRLLLGNSDRYSIDITGGYHKHAMTHLEKLLELMDQGDFWGKKISVRVAVCVGGKILVETLSTPQFIQCPLEPIRELGVEEIGAVTGLRYTGNPDGSGGGAFLSSPIRGRYYFVYGGMFETDPQRRGFDCTTFVGSAFGLPNGQGQGGDGGTVAEALRTESCGMERKHATAIQKFFDDHDTGTYVMWSHGHVVVVKDSAVHEFTDRVSFDAGYQMTDTVAEWLGFAGHKSKTYSVRKIRS